MTDPKNLAKTPITCFQGTVIEFTKQKEQISGVGWGWRYKVAIMNDNSDTADTSKGEFKYALGLCSNEGGSGAANCAKSLKIKQGDVVYGNKQGDLYIILGIFGRNPQTKCGDGLFDCKRGYTEQNKEADLTCLPPGETTGPGGQKGYACVPGSTCPGGPAVGMKLTPANTCEDTTLTNIDEILSNLIKDIQEKQGKLSEYQDKIDEAAEAIKSSLNWLVGEIMKRINEFLVGDPDDPTKPGIIPTALNALYATTYSAIVSTAGPAVANITATEVLEPFVIPVSALEAALICVTNALLEGLVTLIRELLLSMLENIENFVTCVVDQFIGSLLTSVVDRIADGLSGALGGLSGLLGGAIDIITIAQSAISKFNSLGDLLDCNQINKKCDGTKEWIIGAGPKDAMDINQSFDNIFDFVNDTSAIINDAINAGKGIVDSAESVYNSIDDGIKDTVSIFSSSAIAQGDFTNTIKKCIPVYPSSCGSAKINIFGGGGIGGSAIPILGPTVERIINDTSIGQNVNKTANIIGAVLENAGSGYRFPPFVEITDECGIGYGARARSTINNEGQITSIYLVSSGEKYPVNGKTGYGVVEVVVVSPGLEYEEGDKVHDNFGNEYSPIIEDGRIISVSPINNVEVPDLVSIRIDSETGLGAVLKPILGKIDGSTSQIDGSTSQEEVIQVIDCIS